MIRSIGPFGGSSKTVRLNRSVLASPYRFATSSVIPVDLTFILSLLPQGPGLLAARCKSPTARTAVLAGFAASAAARTCA